MLLCSTAQIRWILEVLAEFTKVIKYISISLLDTVSSFIVFLLSIVFLHCKRKMLSHCCLPDLLLKNHPFFIENDKLKVSSLTFVQIISIFKPSYLKLVLIHVLPISQTISSFLFTFLHLLNQIFVL